MSNTQEARSDLIRTWSMPLASRAYDRRIVLTREEQEALAEGETTQSFLPSDLPAVQLLAWLTQPLQDVYELKQMQSSPAIRRGLPLYLRFMYRQLTQIGKSFWGWSQEEWATAHQAVNTICPPRGELITLRLAAYLFGGYLIANDRFSPISLAFLVFGKELVTAQYQRIANIVLETDGFGYTGGQTQKQILLATVTLLMLVNRNPYIDALTVESLHAAQHLAGKKEKFVKTFNRVTRALVHLNVFPSHVWPNPEGEATASLPWAYSEPDVDPQWIAWLRAYMMQTHGLSQAHQKRTFYYLIIVGRWLRKYHPAISTPEQWDETLAYEYTMWVCSAKRGEFVSRDMYMRSVPLDAPQMLQASSIEGRLCAMRQFFKALQKRPYQIEQQMARRLPFLWNPNEVFATPENIRRQLTPNPRNLDQAWWQKLTWAAASLSAKDLSVPMRGIYPLAYYRAAGLLWVTGARRSDEIRRLKVGCVSREWVPEMLDEEGNRLEPEEQLAYLRVPVNKMQGEFWIPIPLYTADAIEAWERLRPKLQYPQIDRKENKPIDYLFMTRNQLMGADFLNRSLIPLLCKVAGLVDEQCVPLRDTVGTITSHRARSTLATWLRRNGLSLTYISKLLGHTDLRSLPWYLREDRHQFARTIRKHNPLERMVTAIFDTNALKRGAGEPAIFYYLGDGPEGKPHLCASPDYQTCVHQMRCTECEMHVDAEQAEIIARRPGVLTIEVHIPTPPQLAHLLDQEEELGMEITRHLPAPEVPNPSYHLNKQMPSRNCRPELQQMKKELEMLTNEWAEKVNKFDMRSVGMKSLKKHITDLTAKIQAVETNTSKSDPT